MFMMSTKYPEIVVCICIPPVEASVEYALLNPKIVIFKIELSANEGTKKVIK